MESLRGRQLARELFQPLQHRVAVRPREHPDWKPTLNRLIRPTVFRMLRMRTKTGTDVALEKLNVFSVVGPERLTAAGRDQPKIDIETTEART